MLVSTGASQPYEPPTSDRLRRPFGSILARPVRCDKAHLSAAIGDVVRLREADLRCDREQWLASDFSPSSTILDASISLYGAHEVSAIREHAAPVRQIGECVQSICEQIREARAHSERRVVFLSGAPGAGKTLVGLELAFDPDLRTDAVFVTGNAPLVDVLSKALQLSYRRSRSTSSLVVESGYAQSHIRQVIDDSTFKLVKAHHFLGERGKRTASSDGSVLIFDEAQRTYARGRRVAGHSLSDHEADLILGALERSYEGGATVVALLGQNQAINRGERGAIAWFEAAERRGWRFAVSDETLQLPELSSDHRWSTHALRIPLEHGHLNHSAARGSFGGRGRACSRRSRTESCSPAPGTACRQPARPGAWPGRALHSGAECGPA